jgi:O-antigen ligase
VVPAQRIALPALGLTGAVWGVVVAAGGPTSAYLCAALIGCAFVLVDFRIGVVGLILLMPLSGSSTLFPHELAGVEGLNPVNVLILGTLASCVLHGLEDGSVRYLIPAPLVWLYLIPIAVAGAIGTQHFHEIATPLLVVYHGLDFAGPAAYLRDFLLKPLLTVVFAVLLGAAVARSERPERFLYPAVIAMSVMAAIEIGYVVGTGITLSQLAAAESREYLSALGLHANDLGRLFATAATLLLFTQADTKDRMARLTLVAALALQLLALLLTFSRGSYVAAGIGGALFLLWRSNARAFVMGALVIGAGLLLLPDVVYERLATGHGQGLDAISAGRVDGLWLPLLSDVAEHPLFGNGLGSILWSFAMRRGGGQNVLLVTHPHNAYLQAALDMGVVGLVLLCAYFVHVWRGLRAAAVRTDVPPILRGLFRGGAAALIALLISDVTDSSLTPRPEQIFLWLAIGMMYGYRGSAIATRAAEPWHEP